MKARLFWTEIFVSCKTLSEPFFGSAAVEVVRCQVVLLKKSM